MKTNNSTIIEAQDYKEHLPEDLYSQISDICDLFHDIQKEAAGIVHHSDMPDASAQLHDVLNATEAATNDILNAALAIQENSSDPKIVDEVTRILEACNFQDLTGQRIKKVLRNLALMDTRLAKLAQTARIQAPEAETEITTVTLERGPQLTDEAASQKDIDALFGSLS